jgi:cytochrome c-type protein NapB
VRRHGQQSRRQNHGQVVKPINPITYRRAAWIFGAILITASVSGYFMGLRQTGSRLNPTRTMSLVVPDAARMAILETESVPVATRYSQQDRLNDGPNAAWENHLNKLVQPVVNRSTLTNVTEVERALALRERASRRAFDGAPPVVPHPVAQDSAAACLACHGPGLVIKDKVASKMSHALHTSCTQCHVPAVGPRIPVVEMALLEPLTENHFAGLDAPLKGSRAWPQAPPTIPHSTLMRSDCVSCHGPQGLYGLRTPHPDRQSCVQCHVPGADLDQHQFLSAGPTP